MAVFAESLTTTTTVSSSKTIAPSDQVTISGSFSVATAQTDKALSIGGVDVSQTVGVYVHSTAAITLETNATDATGGNTLTLAADVPYVWYTGKPDSNRFTQDIASTVYATNASGSTATVTMVFIQDGTP